MNFEVIKETKTYAGITFGPIWEVITAAKKTRETWMGSFFFSWLAEKFIGEIIKIDKTVTFLTPYIDNENYKENSLIAGIIPDHIIFSTSLSEEDLKQKLNDMHNCIVDEFAKIICSTAEKIYKKHGSSEEVIKNFLQQYLQINFVMIQNNPHEDDENGCINDKNAIEKIDELLSSAEENRKLITGKNKTTCKSCKVNPGIIKSIDVKRKEVDLCPVCFFKLWGYQAKETTDKVNSNENFFFPSTREISCYSILSKSEQEKYDNYKLIINDEDSDNEIDTNIKPYKYFCIVYTDGDRLGELARSINNKPEYDFDATELSKRISIFCNTAYKLVLEHHGKPVILGGDDILAFMPVLVEKDEKTTTIIDFILELRDLYIKSINSDNKNTNSTLSAGVSIAYFKSPLELSLETVKKQLFEVAKVKRDTVGISLLLNSGHNYSIAIPFNDSRLVTLNEMLKAAASSKHKTISSVIYTLEKNKTLLMNTPDDRIDYLFKNLFDKEVHEDAEFIKSVKELLKSSKEKEKDLGRDKKHFMEEYYNMIRFFKFLT